MGSSPSKKLKNAIVKTFFSPGSVPLKPNPNHHRISDSSALELTAGRSVRKRARALPIRAKHRAAAAPDGLTHSNGRMGTKLTVCSDLGGFRWAFK